jgi:hypothetical protein
MKAIETDLRRDAELTNWKRVAKKRIRPWIGRRRYAWWADDGLVSMVELRVYKPRAAHGGFCPKGAEASSPGLARQGLPRVRGIHHAVQPGTGCGRVGSVRRAAAGTALR